MNQSDCLRQGLEVLLKICFSLNKIFDTLIITDCEVIVPFSKIESFFIRNFIRSYIYLPNPNEVNTLVHDNLRLHRCLTLGRIFVDDLTSDQISLSNSDDDQCSIPTDNSESDCE